MDRSRRLTDGTRWWTFMRLLLLSIVFLCRPTFTDGLANRSRLLRSDNAPGFADRLPSDSSSNADLSLPISVVLSVLASPSRCPSFFPWPGTMFGMKSTALLLLVSAALAFQAGCQRASRRTSTEPARQPLAMQSPVQDKNFYLLSLLERTAEVRDALENDPVLAGISAERWDRIAQTQDCKYELPCTTEKFRWTEDQISRSADAMAKLYENSPAIHDATEVELRASGVYVGYESLGLSGAELLKEAWADSLRRINRAIEVYGEGGPGTTPTVSRAGTSQTLSRAGRSQAGGSPTDARGSFALCLFRLEPGFRI
jgi:hypothetical protein